MKMSDIGHTFCLVLLIMLSLWLKSSSVTIHLKAPEQYCPLVLFITLYRVILTFEFADEILKGDHSVESC